MSQAFIGWGEDLREETEFMPNTNFRELDFIEEKDLYAECKSDLLESGALTSLTSARSSFGSKSGRRIVVM